MLFTPPRNCYNYPLVIALLIGLGLSSATYAKVSENDLFNDEPWVPGEVIVKFKLGTLKTDGLSPDELTDGSPSSGIKGEYGIKAAERIYSDELLYPKTPVSHPKGVWTWEDWQDSVTEFELDTYYLIKYSGDYDPTEVAAAYNEMGSVDFAEPVTNYYECNYVPNDPLVEEQYYLHNVRVPGADIHAEEAWSLWDPINTSFISFDTPIVAVIDSGVKTTPTEHEDLILNRVGGYDFRWGDSDPNDQRGHGTQVTGVLAATNHNFKGISSPCWNKIRYMPLKVASNIGPYYEIAIVQAMVYAVQEGADVINMSFGSGIIKETIARAVKFVYSNGIVMIASKGNDGNDDHQYPSNYREVIAVTATNEYDDFCTWSSYGPDTDIAAPGQNIATTVYNGPPHYTVLNNANSGTSFSTPLVSAACALIADAVGPTSPPDERIVQTRNILTACADDVNSETYPGWDEYIGHGRLNLYNIALYIDNFENGINSTGKVKANIQVISNTPILSVPTPNPVYDNTSFNYVILGGYTGPGTLNIFDLKGRKAYSTGFSVNGTKGSVNLDISAAGLVPGIYFAQIKTQEPSTPVRFVIGR